MAKTVRTKNGRTVTLLTPSEKGSKCARELRAGVKITNDGYGKCDKNGNPLFLTDTEKAWRHGYLSAQSDSAKCWKAKQNKK